MPGPLFAESYSAPEYNSHFDLGVIAFQGRVGSVLKQDPLIEAYVGTRITGDTRTGDTPFGPQSFTDDAAVLAAGLRIRPIASQPLYFFVEAGGAYDLTDRDRGRWRGDLRGGLVYFREFNMSAPCPGDRDGGVRPVADLYAEAIYYSRFDDNVLFFVRARPGLRLVDTGDFSLDTLAHLAVGFDTKSRPGNNFEELGGSLALRFHPFGRLTLRGEAVHVFRQDGLRSFSTLRVRLEHFVRF